MKSNDSVPFTLLKQPTRHRKNHVSVACVNCKKAHLACDTSRPCKRCVSVGKQDCCYNLKHKKRGRPPLSRSQSQDYQQDAVSMPSLARSSSESNSVSPELKRHSFGTGNEKVQIQEGYSSDPSYSRSCTSDYFKQIETMEPTVWSLMNKPPVGAIYKPKVQLHLHPSHLTILQVLGKPPDFLGYAISELLSTSSTLYDFVHCQDHPKLKHFHQSILNHKLRTNESSSVSLHLRKWNGSFELFSLECLYKMEYLLFSVTKFQHPVFKQNEYYQHVYGFVNPSASFSFTSNNGISQMQE